MVVGQNFTPNPMGEVLRAKEKSNYQWIVLIDKARIIIGTLGLVNALVCLGAGLYLYYYSILAQGSIIGFFLILGGFPMLAGAYFLYTSRYLIGGLLILFPGLFPGYISWVVVFQYIPRIPAEIKWGLAFAIPILISASAFLMHILRGRTRQANRLSTTQNQNTA
jgi:hypothetical protein